VVLIVGDWTAQIGDPSGTSQTRPMLSAEEVRANADTYMQQFFRVVDRERTEVLWQSEWFGKFSLADVISLTSRFTVAQMLARDDFSRRHAEGRPIAVTELLYPLLQAYDSTMMEADVEFGGTDQKFNCLMGRELQKAIGQSQQHVFLMPILVGTDGQQKMSKSLDNYIAIEESPEEMYGKLMSIPDDLMMDYFELLTDVPANELNEFRQQLSAASINPMTLKKRLAADIVGQFHSGTAVQAAEAHFERVVQGREAPTDVPECSLALGELGAAAGEGRFNVSLPDLIVASGIAQSRGEAKRLIGQGGVEIDGRRVTEAQATVADGTVLRAGKRRWVRIIDTDATR
jgi:tyrosyl-tRNA synthetase